MMRANYLATIALALCAALASPSATDPSRNATLLPEVQKHLEDARDCSTNGTPDVAAAHANLILINDEVTYEIEYVDVSDRLKGRCKKALEGALDAWEKALEDTVTFRAVTDPSKADVIIRFRPSVMMGREEVAGYANWKRTLKADGAKVQEVSFKSDLQIRTINLDGNPMPQECIRHEIAHEFGHVLGLDDSETTGDLMGPLDTSHPVGGPKVFESAAVRRLRDEAHKLRTDAMARIQK
jgi:predicted Zn-dependent protease